MYVTLGLSANTDMSYMYSSLLLQKRPAGLVCFILLVCEMGGRCIVIEQHIEN